MAGALKLFMLAALVFPQALGDCDDGSCSSEGGEQMLAMRSVAKLKELKTGKVLDDEEIEDLETLAGMLEESATQVRDLLPVQERPTPVLLHGALTTQGNRIVDQNGDEVRLRGMNLAWAMWDIGSRFYNSQALQWMRDDWGISVVRAVMGVEGDLGYLDQPALKEKITTVCDAAIDLGIYCIIDWHDHNAHTNVAAAQAFFGEMAARYKNAPNVLYEPWFEPEMDSWATVIKPYHETIISTIRQHSQGIIILGTRVWSQMVDEAIGNPASGSNLAYALHFFAGTHEGWLRDSAQSALNRNVAPVFVSHWGTCDILGGTNDEALGAAQTWLDWMALNKVSDVNWAIGDAGNGIPCMAVKAGASGSGNWAAGDLTEAGSFVRDSLRASAGLTD